MQPYKLLKNIESKCDTENSNVSDKSTKYIEYTNEILGRKERKKGTKENVTLN